MDPLDSLIHFELIPKSLDSLQTSQKYFWIIQSDPMNPMNPKFENTVFDALLGEMHPSMATLYTPFQVTSNSKDVLLSGSD
jgi:hypothetical protein